MTLHVKLLTKTAKNPIRATEGSAGLDLFADEDITIPAHCRAWVKTGIAVSIDPGKAGLIWPRSGLAGKGITTDAGLIDSDYRGEIKVLLVNHSAFQFGVNKGNRIAQLVIIPAYGDNVESADELIPTTRGENGFGSTERSEKQRVD